MSMFRPFYYDNEEWCRIDNYVWKRPKNITNRKYIKRKSPITKFTTPNPYDSLFSHT